jgi:hypothetical protein
MRFNSVNDSIATPLSDSTDSVVSGFTPLVHEALIEVANEWIDHHCSNFVDFVNAIHSINPHVKLPKPQNVERVDLPDPWDSVQNAVCVTAWLLTLTVDEQRRVLEKLDVYRPICGLRYITTKTVQCGLFCLGLIASGFVVASMFFFGL